MRGVYTKICVQVVKEKAEENLLAWIGVGEVGVAQTFIPRPAGMCKHSSNTGSAH